MKTLKKTLCLVLAVVMLLGLGAISASAKLEYTDNASITYAEAVDVMSGIGVLVGDETGFRPTDPVKRSEAAKIIAYLMIGNAAQADALSTTTDPFTDVPATHWAAGYIAYCVQRGIINGMGDGTFAPDSNVTGLQFAKMLLCALGYNANDEYVNSDWSISVSKDALTLKLFDGNLAGATNTPATREECALYAFNTLTKEKVSYSALLGGYIESNQFTNGAANESNTIALDFKLHKAVTDRDAFERPTGHHWYVDKTTNIISGTYGDANDEIGDVADLKATYTTAVCGADIFNLLGKTYLDGLKGKINGVAGDVEIYVDGAAYAHYNNDGDLVYNGVGAGLEEAGIDDDPERYITLDNFAKGNTKNLEFTGNGVETNVYTWSEKVGTTTVNHLVITIVNTYMAKVTDVKAGTSSKDPVTKVDLFDGGYTDRNGDYQPLYYDTRVVLDDKGFNTEAFKEDDYVLVTAAATSNGRYAIQSMEAPKTVTSTVGDYDRNGNLITLTSSGSTYVSAKNVADDNDKLFGGNNAEKVNRNIVDGKQHTLYVDQYGYLVAVTDVEAESNYVYVAQFGYKADTTDKLSDKDVLVADIYKADGTNEIVTVNLENRKDGTKIKDTDAEKTTADPAVNCFSDVDIENDDIDGFNNVNTGDLGVYELTMVKGKAVLTRDVYDATGATSTGPNVTKGITRIGNLYRATNSTVFFYVKNAYKDSDFSVTAYTGIDTVPVSKDAKDTDPAQAKFVGGIANTAKKQWKAMEVQDNFAGDKGDTVYYYTGVSYGVRDNENDTWTVRYKVYVDGKEETLALDFTNRDDAVDHWKASDAKAGDFITVKTDAKHTWETVPANDKDDGKFAGSLFDEDILLTVGDLSDDDNKTVFDKNTIYDNDESAEFSYTASTVAFVDVREDVADDDLYTSLTRLQKDFADGDEFTSISIAVKYADNASKQISVIYLTDVN